MPHIFAMHSYLVRAPRFKAETHKRVRRISFYYFVVGNRFTPAVGNRHHSAVFIASADIRFYFALVGFNNAFDKRVIYPRAGLVFYLIRKRQMRGVVFRDYQKPRSVFVYSVHYSGAYYAVYAA